MRVYAGSNYTLYKILSLELIDKVPRDVLYQQQQSDLDM